MKKNWLLLVMIVCLMIISSGLSAGTVLFVNEQAQNVLTRNLQAACERGNLLRAAITDNVQANRDGWKIARQARLQSALHAKDPKTIRTDSEAAEGYRSVVKRLHGLPQVDCSAAVR